MEKKKSILEDALLQLDQLEEAVKQNSKGLLHSVLKEELQDFIKEDVQEGEKTKGGMKDLKNPKEVAESEGGMKDLKNPKTKEPKEEVTEEGGMKDLKNPKEVAEGEGGMKDLKNPKTELPEQEEDLPDDTEDDVEGGEELDTVGDETPLEDEPELDGEDVDDDVLDMTGAPDEDVLKVFKSMKPEDGVVVKKDGDDEVKVSIDDDEYVIKLDDEELMDDEPENDIPDVGDEIGDDLGGEEGEEGLDMGDEEGDEGLDLGDEEGEEPGEDEEEEPLSEEEETVYEIELDDVDEEEETSEEEVDEEEEVGEATNTMAAGRRGLVSKKWNATGKENQMAPHEKSKLNEEYQKLKKQNQLYKKALVDFKDKLQEVALFNSNLAYSTRLFTEHSTTKDEKLDILKRFDSVKSKDDSKNLFEQISKELSSKKPVSESVADKLNSTPKSSSKEVLSEQNSYVNPQFKRMKELMKFNFNK